MKKLLIVAIALVAAAIWYFNSHATPLSYTKEAEVQQVQVEVDALEKRIEASIAASSTAIEARAKAAYENAKRQAEVEIRLQETTAYKMEIEKKEKELMKETSL